ncbi:MAG: GspE/PulE family protein [Planctomycetota bacterium]
MSVVVRGRLGDRLIEKGLLDPSQLDVALNEQKRHHRPLGEILISLGFTTEEDIVRLVAEDLGLDFLRADDITPDPIVLAALDPGFVRETMAFPYLLERGTLQVLVVDPDNPQRLSAIRKRFPYPFALAVTTEAELARLIALHLQASVHRVEELLAEYKDVGSEGAETFPVEQVVNALLTDGIHRGATDIHVEPEGHVTRIRYRCDGILQGAENLPSWATAAVTSRIKILSHLDISERRRPQDGRLHFEIDDDRSVDMRVSVMPSQFGENIVLRILDTQGGVLRLDQLGVPPELQRVLATVSARPHGLFLVTGPTGSGKTTTLYAMLAGMDAMHRKIATIEDPIEYSLPLLRQSQVDPSIEFDFSAGLRALLRQDPDVVLIGEIRDRETADMAIKASMTGHLVLSTLHTNSAIGAVPRLIDIGIEPYLVEDALIGAMAQRLVRRVCSSCAEDVEASPDELRWLGVERATLRRGTGCPRCDGSGFAGRVAIVEVFLPDATMADAMRAGAGAAELERLACRAGFRAMAENGRQLVLAGTTTMEEVLRVSRSHRLSEQERAGL